MTDYADTPTLASKSADADEDTSSIQAPPSRLKKVLKVAGWTWLGIFFMVFFTILKLPEDRVRNYVQGSIASLLSAQNIGFTVGEGHLSILWGASYTMKDVVLSFPSPAEPLKIQEITVTPSLLPLLTGRMGARLRIAQGSATIMGTFSMKKDDISFSYDAKDIDIGKLGVLPALAGIQAGLVVSGSGELSGDFNAPTTINGHLTLDLSQLVMEAQSIMGFSFPRATISEGKIDLAIEKGKATIKALRLGKPGNASEDIRANVTGDMTLARALMQTNLNLKADFSLSPNLMKVGPLDLILGMAKRPDGSYAFVITGPAYNPTALPAPAPK